MGTQQICAQGRQGGKGKGRENVYGFSYPCSCICAIASVDNQCLGLIYLVSPNSPSKLSSPWRCFWPLKSGAAFRVLGAALLSSSFPPCQAQCPPHCRHIMSNNCFFQTEEEEERAGEKEGRIEGRRNGEKQRWKGRKDKRERRRYKLMKHTQGSFHNSKWFVIRLESFPRSRW